MDVCLAINQRLEALGIEQRELAAAAEGHGVLYLPTADAQKVAPSA